ncbi:MULTISPECIES: hypothetical protein [Microbacterium]|uniref:hypothetical protein n=1 Tax=Microbacterium TaxID=33882 RepID=UPI0011EAA2A2|nr:MULTISPECIES: hypothetical protein [Microbacterium]
MNRTARAIALMAGVLVALTLGGCTTMTTDDSRIDEYQTEAEALADEMVALIPADLAPATEPDVESRGRMVQNPVSADPSPDDSVWWQVDVYVEPVQRAAASEDAASAIAAGLLADGWEHTDARETGEGRRTADAYTKDDWYVEVTWVRSEEGKFETVELSVLSPQTTRGDHDEIRS